MSLFEIFALMLSACAAGMINAVAGGGTLVTFPVLILFGVPPVIANATSTLSLVVGTAGSIYGFRRNIEEVRPWFKTFIPISLVGGWLGSFLLTHGKESTFSHLVPYLVLFATLLFMIQGVVRRSVAHQVVLEGMHSKSRAQARFHLIGAMILSVFCLYLWRLLRGWNWHSDAGNARFSRFFGYP